jgi:hypothetical protein
VPPANSGAVALAPTLQNFVLPLNNVLVEVLLVPAVPLNVIFGNSAAVATPMFALAA